MPVSMQIVPHFWAFRGQKDDLLGQVCQLVNNAVHCFLRVESKPVLMLMQLLINSLNILIFIFTFYLSGAT